MLYAPSPRRGLSSLGSQELSSLGSQNTHFQAEKPRGEWPCTLPASRCVSTLRPTPLGSQKGQIWQKTSRILIKKAALLECAGALFPHFPRGFSSKSLPCWSVPELFFLISLEDSHQKGCLAGVCRSSFSSFSPHLIAKRLSLIHISEPTRPY